MITTTPAQIPPPQTYQYPNGKVILKAVDAFKIVGCEDLFCIVPTDHGFKCVHWPSGFGIVETHSIEAPTARREALRAIESAGMDALRAAIKSAMEIAKQKVTA